MTYYDVEDTILEGTWLFWQFGTFLYRTGKAGTGEVASAPAPEDSPMHTVFECPKWDQRRGRCLAAKGGLQPGSITTDMLENEPKWGKGPCKNAGMSRRIFPGAWRCLIVWK